MSAAAVYERIKAAVCTFHGFADDLELEAHIRAITLRVLAVRGVLRSERSA